jgi:hypothetical protein
VARERAPLISARALLSALLSSAIWAVSSRT